MPTSNWNDPYFPKIDATEARSNLPKVGGFEAFGDWKVRVSNLSRPEKVDELSKRLCKLWSGGGGDYGVYTVADEEHKVKHMLHLLLD